MSRTIRVHWSDACSDILVWLSKQPSNRRWTLHYIAEQSAPGAALDVVRTTLDNLKTLGVAGLVEVRMVDGDIPMWSITEAGRREVAGSEGLSDERSDR